jgi:hypothetical protein
MELLVWTQVQFFAVDMDEMGEQQLKWLKEELERALRPGIWFTVNSVNSVPQKNAHLLPTLSKPTNEYYYHGHFLTTTGKGLQASDGGDWLLQLTSATRTGQ